MTKFLYNKYHINRLYSWDRYTTVENRVYSIIRTANSQHSAEIYHGNLYSGYYIDQSAGRIVLTGYGAPAGLSKYYAPIGSMIIEYNSSGQSIYQLNISFPQINKTKGTFLDVVTGTTSSAYPSDGVSGDYWYVSKGYTNTRGAFIETVEATQGTYPDNGISGNYWYVRGDLANAVPWISGTDTHMGGLVKGFTYTYQVDDPDANQELTIVTNFNGQISTTKNASRKTDYEFVITPEIFNVLTLGQDYTITITVSDGQGASANRRITFKRINSAPKITIVNKKLGLQNTPFTIQYSVSDLENDAVSVEFSHKGKVIENIPNVPLDTPQSWTIDNWDFVQIFNGNNAILAKVTDVHGSSSTDIAEFTKEVYGCEIIDHEPVDKICDYIIVQTHNDLYEKIATGEVEVLELHATNNFNDTNPIWEAIELGKVHTFTNKTVTGIPAVGVRYKILASPQLGDSYFYSFTYHWGWM